MSPSLGQCALVACCWARSYLGGMRRDAVARISGDGIVLLYPPLAWTALHAVQEPAICLAHLPIRLPVSARRIDARAICWYALPNAEYSAVTRRAHVELCLAQRAAARRPPRSASSFTPPARPRCPSLTALYASCASRCQALYPCQFNRQRREAEEIARCRCV